VRQVLEALADIRRLDTAPCKGAVERRGVSSVVGQRDSCAPRRADTARFVRADPPSVWRLLMSRRIARTALTIVAIPVVMWWLEPWKLFIRTSLDETLPHGAQTKRVGHFTSHIHQTTGTARLLTLPDGTQIMRVENLHTTQGPQLRVWLSDTRVADGGSRCRKLRRSNHIDLGPMRANRGNANYGIPADADIAGISSVNLWCARFGVSFGAAQLRPLIR
jgi:hypothetical protein